MAGLPAVAALTGSTADGLPAVAAPTGSTADGLPIAVQITGPRHDDDTPITFTELLSQIT